MTRLSEFEIIKRYFDTPVSSPFVAIGIGDDCAVLAPSAGKQLLVSTDMLTEGRHFTLDALPEWIAQKALAVNLSDIAACGATPKAFFLSLGLPKALATDEWLAPFAQSLHSLANKYGCALAKSCASASPCWANHPPRCYAAARPLAIWSGSAAHWAMRP
jgi:thiamine-monophosphate kinase